jgi:hypothetical protein
MQNFTNTLRISRRVLSPRIDAPDAFGPLRGTLLAAVAALGAVPRAPQAGAIPRRMPCKLGVLLAIMGIAWLGGGRPAAAQSAQSVSIFGNAVPKIPAVSNTKAMTFGVKFWSSQSGTISAIRFYRGAVSPNGYIASLYSASGSLLGSVTLSHESGPVPGWQVATFATPIAISPNTTYVAAYYAPSGRQAVTRYGLTNGVTTGPLTAPASATVGGNGVYVYGHAFPTRTYEATNYFVDVLFAPTVATPYLTLSFSPANPSIPSNASAGTVVATINASWSDGSPFTGTLSFGTPYSNDNGMFAISGSNLIISPSGSGVSTDANTVQNVTVVATQ